MNKYLFDTNIFNRILDGDLDLNKMNNMEIFVTHVQLDEIQATKNNVRRSQLVSIFSRVLCEELPTESWVLGISRLDEVKLSDGVLYEQLLQKLNKLNKAKRNNRQDTLIAETAMANGITLVTDDHDLSQAISALGGTACNLDNIFTK